MDSKKLLDSIKEELWKGFQTKEVVVGEHKYILKTLNDGEEVWRDKFIPASANYGFISGAKAPTVGVALVSIDDISVRDIFLTDDEKSKYAEEGTVKTWLRMLGFSSLGERFEVAQRVYDYVSELPSEFVDNLYIQYIELEKVRKSSVEDLFKKK